jgi:beta-lactam-binding protein with PASTA domain
MWRKALGDAVRGAEPFAVALPVTMGGLILALGVFRPGHAGTAVLIASVALLVVLGSLASRLFLALNGSARPLRVAWEIDRRLGLKDAFATSVEIARIPEANLFSAALVEATAGRVRDADVSRAFPVRWLSPGWAAAALLLVAVFLLPAAAPLFQGNAPGPDPTCGWVRVPNLVGTPFERAVTELKNRSLTHGRITWLTTPGRPETVTDQLPPPGLLVKKGSSVHVTAFGVAVPDLVGKPLDDASVEIESKRLKRGRVRWMSAEGPPRRVADQFPEAGRIVRPGSNVDLGVAGVRVPNVLGRPRREAVKTLRDAGLTLGAVMHRPWMGPPETVIGTAPEPQEAVEPGSPVHLVLSKSVEVEGAGGASGASALNREDDSPPTPAEPRVEEGFEGGADGGDGRKPPLLGDPERTPAEFDNVNVQPLFGPVGKSKMAEVEVPVPRVRGEGKSPGPGAVSESVLSDQFIRYEKRAEHALTTGRIGKEDKRTVIEYFERVKVLLNGNGK